MVFFVVAGVSGINIRDFHFGNLWFWSFGLLAPAQSTVRTMSLVPVLQGEKNNDDDVAHCSILINSATVEQHTHGQTVLGWHSLHMANAMPISPHSINRSIQLASTTVSGAQTNKNENKWKSPSMNISASFNRIRTHNNFRVVRAEIDAIAHTWA